MSDISSIWRQTLLPLEATIADAIRNLDKSSLRIVLVVSVDGILQGTITDGDIRRGLLRGLILASPVIAVMNRNALVAPEPMNRDLVLQLMRANKIYQIPIVDNGFKVIGLHLFEEKNAPVVRPNRMVIMVGGRGSRLGEHTQNCPKPLLLVGGRPMLEHIIQRAKSEGFVHFILSVFYLGHMIEDHFGDGSRWQVQIEYLREVEPLGTAGAISLLSPRPDLPFIVTNGDVLTETRYGELLDFHLRNEAVATMASRLHEYQNPFGVVSTQGVNIVGFEEKPVIRSYINAGVYALDPSALECLATNAHCNMTTLFERLRHRGKKTVVYPIHEPWLDIGRPEDLIRAT